MTLANIVKLTKFCLHAQMSTYVLTSENTETLNRHDF